jgi:hypothetical protein
VDFHGEMRKGPRKEAKLCYAHALMKNRNGLVIDLMVSQATGSDEREAAKDMIQRQRRKGVKVKSLGADIGLRHRGLCRFFARSKDFASCGSQHPTKRRFGDRWPHHASSEL